MAGAFEIKLNSKEVCFVDCHAHISAKEFSEVIKILLSDMLSVLKGMLFLHVQYQSGLYFVHRRHTIKCLDS